MNTSISTEKTSDDLDLGPMILRTVTFFRRYRKRLLWSCVIGFAVGVGVYYLLQKRYKANMVLQASILSNPQNLNMITAWDDLLTTRGRPTLAQLFDVPVETLTNLKRITPTLVTATTPSDAAVNVEIDVTDTTVLPAIQQGIVHALENNPYIKERLAIRKQNLEIQLAQARQELQRLDSVTPYLHSFSAGEKDGSGKLILDVSNITNERLGCQDRIANLGETLQFLRAVFVLQGFLQSNSSRGLPAPVLPLVCMLIGFLITYGRIRYKEFREKYMVSAKPVTA